MSYIYKITNKVNQKIYIGKTSKTVAERWNEHLMQYNCIRNEKRPLYSAMRKYGVENFIIDIVEECSYEIENEREIYWIAYYNSYHNGYNATHGGDGKQYIDYSLVLQLWNEGYFISEIAKFTNCSEWSISNFLERNGILSQERLQRSTNKKMRCVEMIDRNTDEILRIFNSIAEANRFLGIKSNDSHISVVCQGKRKTSHGYKWKYHEKI